MLNFAPALPFRSDLDWCYYLRRQGRAGDAIERVLHDVGVMHPGGWADWAPSTLTMTGAPVEMGFVAGSDAMRLITEVADPGSDPVTRVSRVCQIIADLGGTPPSAALRDVISAAQGTGDLRYGARLGLCYGSGELATKLYVELPTATTDLTTLMLPNQFGSVPKIDRSNTQVKMISYDSSNSEIEMYCSIKDATRTMLNALATPLDVSADMLAMWLDRMTDTPAGAQIAQGDLEFSYAMAGSDDVPVLTLHFSAQDLLGTDARIADRIDVLCNGQTPQGYKSLLDHLPPAPSGQTHHGVIGLTLQHGAAAPILSVGLAAPWASPYDVA